MLINTSSTARITVVHEKVHEQVERIEDCQGKIDYRASDNSIIIHPDNIEFKQELVALLKRSSWHLHCLLNPVQC